MSKICNTHVIAFLISGQGILVVLEEAVDREEIPDHSAAEYFSSVIDTFCEYLILWLHCQIPYPIWIILTYRMRNILLPFEKIKIIIYRD
jgi:hypothetical protein